MICPKLSIKSLIVWNTWLYSLSPVQPLKLSALLAAGWHAEHFQSNQLSWGEGWDDTCNTKDSLSHHDTISRRDTKQSRQLQYWDQSTNSQHRLTRPRESFEIRRLRIDLSHLLSFVGWDLRMWRSVDMLQSTDWNQSVRDSQIGLDMLQATPSSPSPPPPQLLPVGFILGFQASYWQYSVTLRPLSGVDLSTFLHLLENSYWEMK